MATQNEEYRERIKLRREELDLLDKKDKLSDDELKRARQLKKEIVDTAKKLKEINDAKLKALASEERAVNNLTGGIYTELQDSQKKTSEIAAKYGDGWLERANKINAVNRSLAELDIADENQRLELLNKRADLMNGMTRLGKEGLEQLEEQNRIAEEYSNLTRDQKKALEASVAAGEKVKQTLQGISETAQTIVSRLFSVKGVMGGLFFAAGSFAEKLVAANKELGQVGTLTDGAANRAAGLSFFFGDSVNALKGLSQELGGTEGLTTSVQLQTNLIASNLGIGAQEAANLTATMSRLNGGSLETAGNLADASRDFARLNNIPVSQLMGDLANSAEQFALFGKEGGKNIIEAAGYAAKLGVSMGQVNGIAENLLDFENSITKELELGARLGKNINLSEARRLAYAGDIEGATKATLAQLGGIEAFNKMDYYQKKATADLLGVSVAELQKMATNQEKANNIARLGQGDFSNLGESVKAVVSQFGPKALKGIGTFLMLSSQANQSFQLMGRMPIFQKLGNNKLGRGISKFFGGGVQDAAGDVSDKGSKLGKKGKGIGGSLKSLAKGLSAMGTPQVLFGALNLIPTAIGMTLMTAGIIGLAGIALLGTAAGIGLQGLAVGLTALGNPAVAGFAAIGVGLILGLSAAMIGLGYSLQLAAPGIQAIGGVIMNVFQGVSLVIRTITESLISFMTAITLDQVASIGLLSLAFMGLAGSLLLLGSAGLFALPTLLGISAAAGGIAIVADLFGLGGQSSETGAIVEGGGETFESQVLTGIDRVVAAIESGMQVNLDGRRISQGLANRDKRAIGENRLVN